MFQFPGFSPLARYYVFNIVGCPIQTSTDQGSFATPRSFSQLTTSFVVSRSLGIPRTPLFASLNVYFFSLYKHSFVLTSSLVNDLFRYSQPHSVTQLFPSGSTFLVDFSYFFAFSLLSVKG